MTPWKAVALTSATKAYWMVGAMIVTVVTARVLGPHGRGVIAAATSWVAMFVTFGHLSLAHVVVSLLTDDDRTRRLGVLAGSMLAITAAVTLAGWATAWTLHAATRGEIFQHIAPGVLLVAFAGLPLLLWMENGNSLLMVLGDLKPLNFAQIAGTTTAIVLVAFAVGVAKQGVTAALAAMLVSYAVVVGLGLTRITREVGRPAASRRVIGELLSGGARLHLSAVGPFFFTHASVILLNHFRPVAEAGYFQLALQLTAATQIVPMSAGVVAYSLVARDGPDRAWPEHRRLVLQTMSYAALVAAVSYAVVPVIVPLLAGPAFVPAVPLVRILVLSIFGMSLATVMVPQWVGRGYFLRATALSLAAGVISVAGNWLSVPRYGMYACAWVMVVSYSVYLAANLAFAWWIEGRPRPRPALAGRDE